MTIGAFLWVGCSAPRPVPTRTVGVPSLAVPSGAIGVIHREVEVITGVDENGFTATESLVEIVPRETPDDATLNIVYDFDPNRPFPFGIEGGRLFVSVFASDGSVVTDRLVPLAHAWAGSVRVAAGDYVIRPYYRSCDPSCSRLDSAQELCSVDQVIEPRQSYDVTVKVREGGASVCSAVAT